MIPRLLHRATRRLRCRLISRDGAPYLERYYLGRIGPVTAYLHRFVDADGDQEVHDHPWRALSIVLTGWYDEQRAHLSGRDGVIGDVRRVRWGNGIGLRTMHQITRVRPDTWTLFLIGVRRKEWGFFRADCGSAATLRVDCGSAAMPREESRSVAALPQAARPQVIYHQPHPPWRGEDWHTAPRAENTARQPWPLPEKRHG